jgi:hypothetical protein
MKDTVKFLTRYNKAILGGLAVGLTALSQVSDGGVTAQEWLGVVLATLGAGGVVWGVPNATKPPAGERGDMDAGLMLMVLTFVGVVLLLFGVTFR